MSYKLRTSGDVLKELAVRFDMINPKTGELNYTSFGMLVKIPPPTIMRWCKGDAEINRENVEKLAEFFEISSAYIVGAITLEEEEIIQAFRKMSVKEKRKLKRSLS